MPDVFAEARQVEDPERFVKGRGYPCVFAGCSGFFHPAGAPTGVILCAPCGSEGIAIRRSWRRLAEEIAAADYPCLRFDYPGTGSSLGRTSDPSSVEEWVAAINSAADYMRRINGVRRFVFIGQRLGALLAVEAAQRRGDVVGLHLVSPVVDGRAYVRDQESDDIEVAMSASFVESLKALDLRQVDRLDVASIFVYDRMNRSEAAAAVEHLRRLGHDVGIEILTPHHPPVADIPTYLAMGKPLPVAPDLVVAAIAAAHPIILPSPTRQPLLTSALAGDDFREEPIRFGPQDSLFGILCRPSQPCDDAPAIVLLDRGFGANVGVGRGTVDQARALAAAGVASLRFDATGIGESAQGLGRPRHLVYSDRLQTDVHAAVDALSARGHTRIAIAGIDGGAYTALSAARSDQRITSVVAVNPQRFVWNPNERVEDVLRFGHRTLADYLAAARTRGALTRLIRNRHQIVPAVRFLVTRGVKSVMAHIPLRLRSVLLRGSMEERIARLFADFALRQTRVALIFSASDAGLVELATYFGPNGRNLRDPNVTVSIVRGAAADIMLDHMIDVVAEAGVPERLSTVRRAA